MFTFVSVPAKAAFASCVPKRGCSLRGCGDSWGGKGLPHSLVSCREVSQGTCVALGLCPRFMLSSPALLMLHYWAQAPCARTSSSSLLLWLCSVCWQQAMGEWFSTRVQPMEPALLSWAEVDHIQGLV